VAALDGVGELGEGVVDQVRLVLGAVRCPWCAALAVGLDFSAVPPLLPPFHVWCLPTSPPRRAPILWLRWAERAS
jgi:hypothetical protein